MKPKKPELSHPALNIVFCCMAGYIQWVLHGEMSFQADIKPKSITLNSMGPLSIDHFIIQQL